jgi:hypothetical protein
LGIGKSAELEGVVSSLWASNTSVISTAETVDIIIIEFEEKGHGNSERVMDFFFLLRCIDPVIGFIVHHTLHKSICGTAQSGVDP